MSSPDRGYDSKLGLLETWITSHANWLALATIIAAFGLRLTYADLCYLNPDEAYHYIAASPDSWLGAFNASLGLAHPPLFILVLHSMLYFGRSELILRMPSVAGGTAALWFTFAWIRRCLGEIPALAGLGFMAVSSAAISASTEVRQYGLLLCFVCGALYATERAFSGRSTRWAIGQGLFLAGALLTHYTAIVFIASLGFYVLIRSMREPIPRRVFLTFCVSQVILAALLCCLYFGEIRGRFFFGPGTNEAYLDRFYYAPANESALGFVWRAISGTFFYPIGMRRLSFLLMLAFVVGIGGIMAGRTRASKLLALLIVTTFGLGFVAAIFRVFPFAGSRHQAYLLPILAAAVAASLACLPKRWIVPALGLGIIMAPVFIARSRPDNNPQTMWIGDMNAAIQLIGAVIPRGSPIFADGATRGVLRYYLTRNDRNLRTVSGHVAIEGRMGAYNVIVSKTDDWAFRADDALEQVHGLARSMGIPAGDPLWIVSTSWLESPLASRLPAGEDRQTEEFGRIDVIEIHAD